MTIQNESMVIEGEQRIAIYRLMTLHKAIKLEMIGIKRHGRSACAIVKEKLGLPMKTSRQKTLDKLEERIKSDLEKL